MRDHRQDPRGDRRAHHEIVHEDRHVALTRREDRDAAQIRDHEERERRANEVDDAHLARRPRRDLPIRQRPCVSAERRHPMCD
jgi:hypothetical protein